MLNEGQGPTGTSEIPVRAGSGLRRGENDPERYLHRILHWPDLNLWNLQPTFGKSLPAHTARLSLLNTVLFRRFAGGQIHFLKKMQRVPYTIVFYGTDQMTRYRRSTRCYRNVIMWLPLNNCLLCSPLINIAIMISRWYQLRRRLAVQWCKSRRKIWVNMKLFNWLLDERTRYVTPHPNHIFNILTGVPVDLLKTQLGYLNLIFCINHKSRYYERMYCINDLQHLIFYSVFSFMDRAHEGMCVWTPQTLCDCTWYLKLELMANMNSVYSFIFDNCIEGVWCSIGIIRIIE